ncbi:MAG: extracellular solute-binding protein, partial [Proteobacteria bacterium]|nr:extracellular solute-binding protein [Pseudomonadota bacterium]
YRSDIFEELGLEVPETWEDLLAVGDTIAEETEMDPINVAGDYVHMLAPLIWNAGGELATQEGDSWEAEVDSEAGREAFAFYARALGGEVAELMTYGESPMCEQMPADSRDQVMHSRIEAPGLVLMGADGPQVEVPAGAGTVINVQVDAVEDAERVFAALLEGGKATMPMQETFWAQRWGMLVDPTASRGWSTACAPRTPRTFPEVQSSTAEEPAVGARRGLSLRSG